jgi:SulP family sulfate permease
VAGVRFSGVSMVRPVRGDLLAGVSVALVAIPQAMAYAELAGLDPVHGLYAAAAGAIGGALVGSSPYLQSGPTAVTSLLTFGALATVADPYTAKLALLAALLAVTVGVVRLAVGLAGGGPIAYLMSQPVVASFTSAAAILIVASQVSTLVGVEVEGANPLVSAFRALRDPTAWSWVDLALGTLAAVAMLGGRRLSPFFPGALLAVIAATVWSVYTDYDGNIVGDVPVRLAVETDLPWSDLGSLLLPAVVIALVGFAEPAAIARRYAAEERKPWDSNKEFLGQGLANVAAGFAGGYPVGGSFSRSALNRLAGARTRWSGACTGLVLLAMLPFTSALAPLPKAVLAGIVIAAAVTLVDFVIQVRLWRWSPLQFSVGAVTVIATLLLAPRVERAVLIGVGMALAVHLWREVQLSVPSRAEGDTLHLWPSGVLYFGSAPGMEKVVNQLIAEQPALSRVVIHLSGLGRVDLTGALMLRDLVEEAESSGVTVEVREARPHMAKILTRVLGDTTTVHLMENEER